MVLRLGPLGHLVQRGQLSYGGQLPPLEYLQFGPACPLPTCIGSGSLILETEENGITAAGYCKA